MDVSSNHSVPHSLHLFICNVFTTNQITTYLKVVSNLKISRISAHLVGAENTAPGSRLAAEEVETQGGARGEVTCDARGSGGRTVGGRLGPAHVHLKHVVVSVQKR